MSTTKEIVVKGRETTVVEQTLEDLAALAKAEHAAVVGAATDALSRAILAGETLLKAKDRVESGGWINWVEAEAGIPYNTAKGYMRVASYREEILARDDPQQNLRQALEALNGAPSKVPNIQVTPDHIKQQVKQMHSDGVPVNRIARELGVARSAAQRWVNPASKEKQREADARLRVRRARAKAARQALLDQEKRAARDAAAKTAGGDIAKAYSLIRQTAAAVDRAADQCASKDDAKALRATLTHVYKIEDEICRILRTA